MFEYVNVSHPEIKSIWLSKNRTVINQLNQAGYQSFHAWSVFGIWYAFRAKYSFLSCGFEDVNRLGVVHSTAIQFWHGIPMKKIRYDDPNNLSRDSSGIFSKLFLIIFPFYREDFDYLISTGKVCSTRFSSAFRIKPNQLLETGYPRTDVLFIKNDDLTNSQLNENAKLILYAPTHRKEGKTEFDYFNDFDVKKWDMLAKNNNLKLMVRLHYYDQKYIEEYKIRFSSQDSIHFIDSLQEDDINQCLNNYFTLITDYSSVWYDYLLLNRPIIFYAPDLEQYLQEDRNHYNLYTDEVAGQITTSWDNTMDEIQKNCDGIDEWTSIRNKKILDYYRFNDGHSAKRLTDYILKNG